MTDQIKLRGYVSLANDFRAGKTTPRAYLDETLDRIGKLDPHIGAFVVVDKEGAIKTADASTARWRQGKPLSPVDGMPVAIKDIIETADMPTGQGSPMWDGTKTRRDSAAVHALREAGAIIVGKSTTTEFAASHPFHTTKNPHDASRTPGGSSSGSAAAVGAGMVPAGLGTQLVGSILRPASFCGCVGFKPSLGAINRSGSYDHFSQSCQGSIAATLADAWLVLRAIADRAGGDPGFAGLAGDADFSRREKPKRLAVLETGGWRSTTEGARRAFAVARERLAATGVELRSRADDPEIEEAERALADAQPLTLAINAWEGRWPLNTYADLAKSKISVPSLKRLSDGEAMTQREYSELIARRADVRATYDKTASRYDGFVTLAACGAAPVGLGSTGNTIMNAAASLAGVPALTLPLLSDDGLPLGLQLMGRRDGDAALFELASWVAATAFERVDLVGATGG